SVLLPRFRGIGVYEFTTVGIFTEDAEFEVGGSDGALTTYRTIELTGTARTVLIMDDAPIAPRRGPNLGKGVGISRRAFVPGGNLHLGPAVLRLEPEALPGRAAPSRRRVRTRPQAVTGLIMTLAKYALQFVHKGRTRMTNMRVRRP